MSQLKIIPKSKEHKREVMVLSEVTTNLLPTLLISWDRSPG